MKLLCWNCGHALDDVPKPISRHEHCRECFEALHCCRLCQHYRSDINSRCHEDRAEPPMNKESGNFCEYFRPDTGAFSSRRPPHSEAAETRLDDLFSTPEREAHTPEDQARDKLNSLFTKP